MYNPDITIVGGGGGSGGPNPPIIVSISQAQGILPVGIVQDRVTGAFPIVSYNLYRSDSMAGPWTRIYSVDISTVAIETFAFDTAPIFGVTEFYAATAVDDQGNESGLSNIVPFAAFRATATGAANIPAGSYGPYPLLGVDVFISPITREAVVGPNGDLLTVNGLECLAQDLRCRILTEKGELACHQEFGFTKDKFIGSGQAKPSVQAQILRADIIDVLTSEPRVLQVLQVAIYQSDDYSWIIEYDIMAIGVEDPQRFNLVYPFYLQ